MARGYEPPREETPPPLPWYLPPDAFTQQRNQHLINALPWYLPPAMYVRQRQRHNQPPSRSETLATLDTATARNPNANRPATPTSGPSQINLGGTSITQGVGAPQRPPLRNPFPTATGQGGGGGGLPPTRLQNPMIQAYLNMLMRKRTR